MTSDPVRIRLLGPFEAVVDGQPVRLSAGRLRALLAALALSAGEFVSVSRLADAVWGEDQPTDVRRSMQTYVARLRAAIGAPVIVTELGGYALRVDPDLVDAVRFQRLLDAAGQAADRETEHALLSEALALWRGTPLAGVPSETLAAGDGARLTETYLSALERRIDLDLDAADRIPGAELTAELRELATRHPLRESLWARYLRALIAGGRPAEALEQYGAIRTRISAELGVDPGPELQRLYADLLAGDDASAGAVTVLPTGRAARLELAVPQQLPSDTPRFVGRDAELRRLDELLRNGLDSERTNTVVVLHGAGGTGKSAIAVHWAQRSGDYFPGGRLFCNLRGYGPGEPADPAATLDDVLRSLGIRSEQIPDGIDARSALLRTSLSGRRALLVLDNARDAEQVRPLLPGGGSVVLVTSRSRLSGLAARDGAGLVAIDELPAGQARDLLARGLGEHAAEIDTGMLAEVADLCGRLPLALNLAAERLARVPGEQGAQVRRLRGLANRLDVLDSGDQDPESNLRAVFSWSLQALEPELARMFRLLGLHPGGEFGAEASAALLGTSVQAARRGIERLAGVHLVREPRPGRYVLHDLLRAYAIEQADEVDGPDQVRAAELRLLSWYAHSLDHAWLVVRSSRLLSPLPPPAPDVVPLEFDSERESLEWLDLERRALIALVHHAATRGYDVQVVEVASRMWAYLDIRDELDEAMAVQQVALEAAERTGDPALEAAAANQLGTGLGRSGRAKEAMPLFERAARLFHSAGNIDGEAAVHTNIGLAQHLNGDLQGSLATLRRGLELSATASSRPTLLNNLATVLTKLGRYDEAVAAATEAMEIHRKEGLRRHEAYVLDTLGMAYAGQGSTEEAIEALSASARMHRELGNLASEAVALRNLGLVHRDAGRPDAARQSWNEALAIARRLATRRGDDDVAPAELAGLLAGLR